MDTDSIERTCVGFGGYCAPAFLMLASLASAHDIPSDVTAHVFVRPSGGRLQVIVRAPLRVVRDVDFPERNDGYLDMEKVSPLLPDLAKIWFADFIELHEGDARLPKPRVAATQISAASDRSFASFDEALAHVNGAKPANGENLVWNQVLFDVLLEYPIGSDASEFAIRPRLDHLAARVVTALRFLPAGGAERAYEFRGDPGLTPLDPRWSQAARRFVELGFWHILDGKDHLLFLLCLVIPFRRFRPLVGIVTAFTVAHSITLLASAYGWAPGALWFPPLIETLIGLSIVWMAVENIVGASSHSRRSAMAFGFGLVHGFGFSFALRDTLQFAGSHLITSLAAFNVGVELGQLLVLAILIPALSALFRWAVAERMGTIILSAFVAHTGWHWLTERAADLGKWKLGWPVIDAAFLVASMRGAMFAMLVVGAAWGANKWARHVRRASSRNHTPV